MFPHLNVPQSWRPIFLWLGLLVYFNSRTNGEPLGNSCLNQYRSCERVVASIVQVPTTSKAHAGCSSITSNGAEGVVLAEVEDVARVDVRFGFGAASCDSLSRVRLPLEFWGRVCRADREVTVALLTFFLGGIASF